MLQLIAIIAGLCSAFFVFYTIRLLAVTRFLTQLRPGGSGAWVGAVVFPALALLFAWAAIRLWRLPHSRPVSSTADFDKPR
ncbi:MAG TPA: hypothetical protein VJW73_17690 [Gemmatimonadaceae bacterium]|nr:hypothetical protein [Gemmatimonadaceae bacterium]